MEVGEGKIVTAKKKVLAAPSYLGRAIHSKSGRAQAHTLRAFHFYPWPALSKISYKIFTRFPQQEHRVSNSRINSKLYFKSAAPCRLLQGARAENIREVQLKSMLKNNHAPGFPIITPSETGGKQTKQNAPSTNEIKAQNFHGAPSPPPEPKNECVPQRLKNQHNTLRVCCVDD